MCPFQTKSPTVKIANLKYSFKKQYESIIYVASFT